MMRVTKAVASAVLLVGLLVGVPVVLWVVAGSPVPDDLPSMEQVKSTLAAPDYTGAVLVGTLKIIGWLAWVTFAWATAAELVAQVRQRSAPRLRGLGFQQQVAAALIGAVLVGFSWQAAAAAPHRAAGAGLAAPAAVTALVDEVTPVDQHLTDLDPDPEPVATGATATHTVVKGDTLWGLAVQHLGDGTRWREIYDLNAGRQMPDGHVLSDPGWLDPGWELLVPDESSGGSGVVEHTRTVVRGDTLSHIALDELGDANRYPEIYEASTDTVQPDGRHLVDPDLIYPGWQVTIPGAPAVTSDPQEPSQDSTAGHGTGDPQPGASQPGASQTGDTQTAGASEPGTAVPGQPTTQPGQSTETATSGDRGDQWAPSV
ncbi:MAG: LysM peptidoglycan-binding domain-containing protein, partial [Micrococcales bacterium]|nr:LysM peptidoglycan-binding domain-containing protein [Micrococcales bacterium]